jgi:hypothetical protein
MESDFGRDFSRVRIHADAQAAASAHAVDAVAYTVGQHIAFSEGGYAPNIDEGRRLLAHELTHVVQQSDSALSPSSLSQLTLDSASSPAEIEARAVGAGSMPSSLRGDAGASVVHRADPQAVRLTRHLGRTPRTGVQFWPTNIADTVVGPVEAQGGLLGGGISRLHVIIGQNLTLNALLRLRHRARLRHYHLTSSPRTSWPRHCWFTTSTSSRCRP